MPQVSLNVGDNLNKVFDEIVNCKVLNRKSDTGFTEANTLMLAMRDGTLSYGDDKSNFRLDDFTFFTGTDGVRRAYISYDGQIFWRTSSNWSNIASTAGAAWKFSIVKLPVGTSSSYTNAAVSSGGERIKKAAGDASPLSNIGKFLYIDKGSAIGIRNRWSQITDYDTTSAEYILGFSGVNVPIPSGTTYLIYDRIGDVLQAVDANGTANDRYFPTQNEDSYYAGQMTVALRDVRAIGSSEYTKNNAVLFNGAYAVAVNSDIYISYGLSSIVGNPFSFSIPDTLPLPESSLVRQFFRFKDYLVVGGDTFVYLINKSLDIQTISENYGIRGLSISDVESDVYFMTNSNQLISLRENINGVVTPSNIGKVVQNYLNTMNYNVVSGFNGEKFFLYGEETDSQTTAGTMLVFDVPNKFWSTYTGLRPSKIIFEGDKTYLAVRGKVVYFSNTVQTDAILGGTQPIEQSVTSKEITGSGFNILKRFLHMDIWLENFTQRLSVETWFTFFKTNTGLPTRFIREIQKSVSGGPANTSVMGGSNLGSSVIGGTNFTEGTSSNFYWRVRTGSDDAVSFRFKLTGLTEDGVTYPFYLSEVRVNYEEKGNDSYFDSERVI